MAMTKDELIEAIEATLISNKEKAITADALRNLLTDIVENSGQGGGSGGGISFFLHFNRETNDDGTETITSLLTTAQIAHNKEQIEILKQLHAEGKPIPPISYDLPTSMLLGEDVPNASVAMSYMHIIFWEIDAIGGEDVFPEGMVVPSFPLISTNDLCFIQGDGTIYCLDA